MSGQRDNPNSCSPSIVAVQVQSHVHSLAAFHSIFQRCFLPSASSGFEGGCGPCRSYVIPVSSQSVWASVIKRHKTRSRTTAFCEGLVQCAPAWAAVVISILWNFVLWWIMTITSIWKSLQKHEQSGDWIIVKAVLCSAQGNPIDLSAIPKK